MASELSSIPMQLLLVAICIVNAVLVSSDEVPSYSRVPPFHQKNNIEGIAECQAAFGGIGVCIKDLIKLFPGAGGLPGIGGGGAAVPPVPGENTPPAADDDTDPQPEIPGIGGGLPGLIPGIGGGLPGLIPGIGGGPVLGPDCCKVAIKINKACGSLMVPNPFFSFFLDKLCPPA